jgi:hypothetical protein
VPARVYPFRATSHRALFKLTYDTIAAKKSVLVLGNRDIKFIKGAQSVLEWMLAGAARGATIATTSPLPPSAPTLHPPSPNIFYMNINVSGDTTSHHIPLSSQAAMPKVIPIATNKCLDYFMISPNAQCGELVTHVLTLMTVFNSACTCSSIINVILYTL